MKLVTQAVLGKLLKFEPYSQDGAGLNAEILCKFFTPDGSWSWFVLEADAVETEGGNVDWRFFGIATDGEHVEFGYFDFADMKKVRGSLTLPIERDLHFNIKTVRELRESCEIRKGSLDWMTEGVSDGSKD